MSETTTRDYRATLNLPSTVFPMQAELPKREPARVEWWRERRTYERRLERNRGRTAWILHDGPPYANGELHMGHFLNMVLKDTFVKIALLDGRWAKFVPGWDMHGLPIELETLKHLGIKDFHTVDPLELRARCKERAIFWFERQRGVRVRMGTFGDYDHAYRTIDPSYEAVIVETLAALAEQEQIYKGLRATLWCIHDETALAEAEIEYENKKSPSICVRYPMTKTQREELLTRIGGPSTAPLRGYAQDDKANVSVLIWTTTPWTLPSTVAIALRAEASYGLYRIGDEMLLLAEALAPAALGTAFERAELVARASGSDLEGLTTGHPFLERSLPLVLADYVDLETGTGAVHTAPGHGADDFETGARYGLPVLCPVDATGRFTPEAGRYAGLQIFAADAKIVEDLRASGMLWRAEEIEHSYPHCWRCHNPVIFRATSQWFIAMDRNDLRSRALAATEEVAYTPEWGRQRQRQMIEHHPEWCVSRQRTWGTPIPAVVCLACDESVLDPAVARNAAARFALVGADAWWRDPIETYLPKGFACRACGGTRFAAERDIVDIWFESGVTHLAVLGRDGLPWPSDAVIEGGDQYRGWFRSSLITGVAIKGGAPYKHVVKNGWVNDEQGRPMSKSRGTGLDAEVAMEHWGADVLRLWAASTEFVDDVRFGPNVIEQVGRVYRNIRNRIRFMLANVGDLEPDAIVERNAMRPLDRLACDYADGAFHGIYRAYLDFDVHATYLKMLEFEREMSALYFDAVKDALYSRAKSDPRRRSAQSALLYLLTGFLTAIAPVLSFTAEEAWQALPESLRGERESVFDLHFNAGKPAGDSMLEDWETLRTLRAKIASNAELRDFEAKAVLNATPEFRERWFALGGFDEADLREALVVSQLEILAGKEPALTILPADGEKCARCWKYRALGVDAQHPGLCEECAQVVRALHRVTEG
ncbi:MAG TPA: isoleucine--tRNA ligase [Candidatus Tyrphobacter sp.]